jgi:hypothetical protein
MKKYLNIKSGFIRFNNDIELNWSLYEWALLFSIDFSNNYLFLRFLCVSIILPIKFNK